MIDFTNSPIIMGRAYNGANGKKLAVSYNNEIYMLKFPPNASDKPTTLSYTNSCICEHIGSCLFNMLGIEAQTTLLGTYSVHGKLKVVCACKDFETEGNSLIDFCSIKNTVIESSSNGTGTELSDVLETIELQNYIDPKSLREHFWDIFIVDALLGNFDRHNGNWGFIYDATSNSARLAPVFDCGSCLLPQADDQIMRAVIENEEELAARIYTFPTSILKEDGKKINYYNYLTSTDNKDCIAALKRIYPGINMSEINTFIDSLEITDLQKQFYKTYINARYTMIIRTAYDRLKLCGCLGI